MSDWIEFGKTFGIPTLIIAALFYFIYLCVWKLIWPFILSQQEKSEKAKEQERLDRIAERDKYLESMQSRDVMMKDSLAARDKMMEESIKGVVASLNVLTTEVKRLMGGQKMNPNNLNLGWIIFSITILIPGLLELYSAWKLRKYLNLSGSLLPFWFSLSNGIWWTLFSLLVVLVSIFW